MRACPALLAAAALAGCGERAEGGNMTAEEIAGELAKMRIEPGMWELASEVLDVRAPDLPHEVRQRMIGPRARRRHCITPAQAQRPEANFLAMQEGSDCVYRRFGVADGRISGEMICPNVTAQMRGRYRPDGYDTRMAMASPMENGATMTLTLRSRGRRIGDCGEDQS